jgi:hypothetical protein
MIEYSFESKKIINELVYLIDVKEPYEMLYDLSSGFLSQSEGVEEVLTGIQKVVSGESAKYSFGGSDYCIIDVYKDESKIYYDFGENESAISTNELIRLLNDWKIFLKKNNK